MHEVGHVAGMSVSLFPLFRDAVGAPRTPRSTVFPNRVAPAFIRAATCTIEGGC